MRRILSGPCHRDERGHFHFGRAPRGSKRGVDEVVRIRRLIRLLINHDTADRKRIGLARSGRRYVAFGSIYRKVTTYEEIFALCQQIDYWMHGLSDNALTTPLLYLLEQNAGTIVDGRGRRARIVALGQLATSATAFIQAVVADALRGTPIRGFDLLRELISAPDVAQVNIVTLNHDTLVEQVLARTGVSVVDGFGDPDGDVRWYDDTCYSEPRARVRLIKLHGSIDWHRFRRGARISPAIVAHGDPTKAVDGAGTHLEPVSPTPSFLTGGEKEAWYQQGVYADLHFRFHELLRRCDRMVMSGYGWGDTGITNQIDRWLEQRPSNRLILLEERPEQIVDRSPIIEGAYDDLIRRGQLVPVRSWMCNTNLAVIRPALTQDQLNR